MNRFFFIVFLSLLTISNIIAHPHVFIDIGMEIESMESVKILWTFDRIESENKIYYFDDDENGTLNQEESNNLYQEGFKSVKDYNYFLTISTDSGQFPVEEISQFKTLINSDGRLTVSFVIDLPQIESSTISISHLDTSYFIAFSDPISSDIKVSENLFSKAFKNKDKPIYYDPNAARTVTLDTSEPKDGWLTAYPTQVVISREPIEGFNEDIKLGIKDKIINIQKDLYKKLSSELINPKSISVILFLALLYGIVHALGPGHRKILISSYILSREKTSYIKTIGISLLSAFIHSASGVIIILLLNLIYNSVHPLFVDKITDALGLVSYISIMLLSIILIILKIIKQYKKDSKNNKDQPAALSLILLSSIIPCPGALTIMLFSLSMSMILLGLWTVLSMSLGIGLTLSIIGIITLKGKNSINRYSTRFKYLNIIFEWIGIIILFLFSLFMILSETQF